MTVWADPPVPSVRIEAVPPLFFFFFFFFSLCSSSCKDSGRRHLCLEEVSRGFLRPSREETLASNRSRSVGE